MSLIYSTSFFQNYFTDLFLLSENYFMLITKTECYILLQRSLIKELIWEVAGFPGCIFT